MKSDVVVVGAGPVGLSGGSALKAGAVIAAARVGSVAPNRPDLPDNEAYEGRFVFYSIARRDDLANKPVVIVGGGEAAVDWANFLQDICAPVALARRRTRLRAAPESLRQLDQAVRARKVSTVVPFRLTGLQGEIGTGVLSSVTVKSLDGEDRALDADGQEAVP